MMDRLERLIIGLGPGVTVFAVVVVLVSWIVFFVGIWMDFTR